MDNLLLKRRFLPLLITQVSGAFNDNLFKYTLVMLVTYRFADLVAEAGGSFWLSAGNATAIFILPFVLLSPLGGQLADRLEKSNLVRLLKLIEVGIMLAAAVGLVMIELLDSPLASLGFLLGVLFLMGAQSALMSPIKYAIMPEHLSERELVTGNAWMEAGVFLFILAGTLSGSLLTTAPNGLLWIAPLLVAVALIGYLTSRQMPPSTAGHPELQINFNVFGVAWSMMKQAHSNRIVFFSILGIAWFYLIGGAYLTHLPKFANEILRADSGVVALFLATFSIGIWIGAYLCQRTLKGQISARLVPFAALGIAIFAIDIYFAAQAAVIGSDSALNVGQFLAHPQNWRILIDLLLIAVFGGVYVVPLYALVEFHSEQAHRARTIAASNILNALFVVAINLTIESLYGFGLDVSQVFLITALTHLLVLGYIIYLLPRSTMKGLIAALLKLLYRVEVRGAEHYQQLGERAVIIVNHTSFIDAPLIGSLLPGRPMFAISTIIAQAWWVKPWLHLVEVFRMDPTNPLSTKALIREVRKGQHCVIFPEGRITRTGGLMKVYEGAGLVADRADATVLPVQIEGALYTPFSHMHGKLRIRWFPKIRMNILPPRRLEIADELRGRARRREAGRLLYDVMAEMAFAARDYRKELYQVLLEARAIHGGKQIVLEDIDFQPMAYNRLILASQVLGRRLAAQSERGERVGVMLPTSIGNVVTLFALTAFGRVPTLLNFSAGAAGVISACRTATVKQVLTARRFIERGKLHALVEALEKEVDVVYLEDVRAEIGTPARLRGLLDNALLPWRQPQSKPDDPAVVLFTSGSEGAPKGVVLSHANLLANTTQIGIRIHFTSQDVVLNALPMFHSFGLTAGCLTPLLGGAKAFLYPTPLHYRIIPEMAYGFNATLFFATDTFLSGYARFAHPYDFSSIRQVFAGAEKLQEKTRRQWMERFGLRILEGYGVTETAPVLSANTPMQARSGSVGRFVPGIEYRLEAVPGVDAGGRLWVRGPNVMLGYLRADNPGVLQPLDEGWYDTGDIVDIDREGFITIVGRAKRFAKVAGEMVSLGAVEELIARTWPEHQHAVLSRPDPRKGEELVAITTHPQPERAPIAAEAQRVGQSELLVPRRFMQIDAIPLMATGKTDYVGLKRWMEAQEQK